MYRLVSTISVFIRAVILSNQFTKLFKLYFLNATYSGLAIIFSDIFNFAVRGVILCLVCCLLVEIIYESRSCPT